MLAAPKQSEVGLTIVLVTGGRAEFTHRFLNHANKLPFKLIVDESPDRLAVDEYFAKIRDSVHRVNTPYAMLADNDDLPTKDLQRCVDWLKYLPGYVCACGRIEGFRMWPDSVTGPHSMVTGQYSPYDTPADYSQETANERVLAGFANSWSYYGVYRTEVLAQVWYEVCDLGLTNLQIHEKFCAMRTLTLGKIRCSPHFTTLYRQHGTGQGTRWRPPNAETVKVMNVMAKAGVDTGELTWRWCEWYRARDRYFHSSWRKAITKIKESRWLNRQELAL